MTPTPTAVGIDVGTSAVKGAGDRRRRARCWRAPRPAIRSRRRARLGGAGSRGLVAGARDSAGAAGAQAGNPAGIGLSRPDARPRRARRRRPRAAPGDPLERPAHRRRVRRDRGDDRPRAADRADRQPRAARASRRRSCCGCAATSPRSTRRIARIALPKDYVRLRLCGEHATDVSDASGTLLLDVAGAPLERRGARRARARPELAARGAREPGGVRRHTRTASRSRPAAGDQAAGALGVGVDRPGPLSVVLGTSGVVFAALRRVRRRPEAACTRSATPSRGLARDGGDALGRRLAALAAGRGRAGRARTRSCWPRRSAWPPGVEGLIFLPYLAGERTPHADPDARGAFIGLSAAPRPRRARARGARGRGLRAARLARPDRAGSACRPTRRPRLGRRRAQRAVAPDRRLGARAAARAVAVDEGAAFGAALLGGVAASVWPDVHAAVAATVRRTDGSSRCPSGSRCTASARARYPALYPALRRI